MAVSACSLVEGYEEMPHASSGDLKPCRVTAVKA
jgi:hypothetical protein